MGSKSFDVVIIGAGFGGIGTAIQLKKLGYENLLIVDREDDLGGTWHVNRYPGLACDLPSTSYSYRFEPNPYWSRLYAPGAEIKQYAEFVADKYDVRRHMRFNTVVDSARWDEDTQHWQVTLGDGSTIVTRFLIAATGVLSQPYYPDIAGIGDFAGRIIHTTAWDDDYDFAGRRVGIIGTGATAVQVIPELAKEVADLTVYQRTPIYVIPKQDLNLPPLVQRVFARVPLTQRAVRLLSDAACEAGFGLAVLRYRRFWWLNKSAAFASRALRFVSVRDKDLRRKLTPTYTFGCKRPTYSNSYYRTFAEPNVRLQSAGIDRIEPDGIVATDGSKTEIDTLVLATGFDMWEANVPAIEIIGRDGRNLGKWWCSNGWKVYEGVSIPHFPNLLNLTSAYSVSLNFFDMIDYQMRHMERLFGEVRRRNATTFEATEEASDRFCRRFGELQLNTVFSRGDCANSNSYYYAPDGVTYVRSTSTRDSVTSQSRFALSDYAFG